MSKRRLVTVVVVVGAVAVLIINLPMTQVRANHCHPEHTEAAAPPKKANKTVMPRVSSPARRPARTRVPGNHNGPSGSAISKANNESGASQTLSFEELYSREFPMAIMSLGEAIKAMKSGDRQTEVAELTKATERLLAVYKALSAGARPQFANSLICPIMGSSIDMNTFDANLTRDYKGRKVAFCCAGCPSEWDKLDDSQKQTKMPGAKF